METRTEKDVLLEGDEEADAAESDDFVEEGGGPSARRIQSLYVMRKRLSDSLATAAPGDLSSPSHGSGGRRKPKEFLKQWDSFTTVSFPTEASKDWRQTSTLITPEKEESGRKTKRGCLGRSYSQVTTWLLPGLIGFLTASSGVLIERASSRLNGLLFGVCAGGEPGAVGVARALSLALLPEEKCSAEGGHWTAWGGNGLSSSEQALPEYLRGWFAYVVVAALLASTSAFLVQRFAPTARGSGIPEVKTILGGFVMNEVLEFKTLVVKVVGLALSVASGMALGKEGPLVHVACCWANCCSRLSQRYMANEGKRRELISTAAAAGVAVAFGSPVGGVLFSYEEVSTMFPQKTMIRAFFAAVVAALTLLWYNPSGTGRLTMFEASVPQMPSIVEYPWFVLLGALGGALGALFVHWNVKVTAARAPGTAFRKWVPIVVEVAFIAGMTALTNFPSRFTSQLSPVTIHALFHTCDDKFSLRPDMMGLCDGEEPVLEAQLVASLAAAAALRFLQMTVTFGTGVPCGLFVPSLYTGACLGRILGIFVRLFNVHMGFPQTELHPGVYAMVGAAAVLGGVCRVTISLVVIMYELTSALQLVVPFMISVLTAKWVGDYLTRGIYDCHISLRGYPYLHEPDGFTYGTRACDIMDEDLECVYADAGILGELLAKVRKTSFGGFPVVRSERDRSLLGYVHAKQVQEHLEKLLRQGVSLKARMRCVRGPPTLSCSSTPTTTRSAPTPYSAGAHGEIIDIAELVDETVLRLVPETPLAQVHNIFRQLGVKVVLVARHAELVGLITKKSFVHHLETGCIGHIANDPAVCGDGGDGGGSCSLPVRTRSATQRHGSHGSVAPALGGLRRAAFTRGAGRGGGGVSRGGRGGHGGGPLLPGAVFVEDSPQSHASSVVGGSPLSDVAAFGASPARKASLKAMREHLVHAFTRSATTPLRMSPSFGFQVSPAGMPAKSKDPLTKWKGYSTVSWRIDELRDFHEHTSILSKGSALDRLRLAAVPWLIPALVGALTATTGSLIEVVSERISALRFGFCAGSPFDSREACGAAWTEWSGDWSASFLAYVAWSTAFASLSAWLVWAFAPTARGSGIPEVKTILGGFVMSDVLEFKTLVVKVIGLTLSVSSGMSLGKEGPLVHVACCWANVCSRLSRRFVENEAKRRELISTAAAAGVSVAFGTPLGGVLFSYEEVSTMFPQKTMVRAFFAAVVAALTLRWWNPTGTGKLTMFEMHFGGMPDLVEYPLFLLLGALGGVIGALFVHCNIKISAARRDGTPFRQRVHIVAEVATIALITALTSYPLELTRSLSSVTIRSLFQSCDTVPEGIDMMGLCDENGADLIDSGLIASLMLAALLRLVQMTFTFGTGVPCGLFVPSLYTGACLGRCLGLFVSVLNARYHFVPGAINPGVYAMVGAAAVLGGVCRVTISLVVIMFGLTSALQLIVPFMLAILTAKFVGDIFGDGIYDASIILRGYPYLHEPDDVSFEARACDIMDDELECLSAQEPITVGQLLKTLETTDFSGFPLISSQLNKTLLGYVHAQPLRRHLEASLLMAPDLPLAFRKYADGKVTPGAMDISKFVDETVVRIVPETPLAQVHQIFRHLGVKLILVARFGRLAGLITKKAFVHHLQDGHIGHIAHDPAVGAEPEAAPHPVGIARDQGLAAPLLEA